MKQIFNISAFIIVLSIPFALSSQTRKAIPAGRYEALSGVKNSRALKSLDTNTLSNKDSLNLFWNEVLGHIPKESKGLTFFSTGKMDSNWTDLLVKNGLSKTEEIGESTNVIFSDDLKRDRDLFKTIKAKGHLIVLKGAATLPEVLSTLNQYEVIVYQADTDASFYLLKQK